MKTSGVSDKKISRHETPTDITRSDNIFHSLGSLLCPLNCWDVLRVTRRNKITQSVPLHNTVPSYSMMAVRHSKQVILTTGTQCQRPQQNCFLFHNFTTVDTLPHWPLLQQYKAKSTTACLTTTADLVGRTLSSVRYKQFSTSVRRVRSSVNVVTRPGFENWNRMSREGGGGNYYEV
jgi:hypothetical protein